MTMNMTKRFAAGLVFVLLLSSCDSYTQTTSGRDYMRHYAAQSKLAGVGGAEMDSEVRAAASVEPLLTFPARIGLARLDGNRMSSIPPEEAESWMALTKRLGSGWGEFMTVSPIIVKLMSQAGRDCNYNYWVCSEVTARDVQLAAARQHLDAVLLYETYSTSEIKSNPLAITKLALIGFFLPTENVEADGRAQAVLFDVRNGYTYGFASARAEDAGLKLSTSGNEYANARIMQHNAKTTAVANLAVEVETMMRDLRLQLAEKRAVPVEPVLEKKAGVK